MQNAVYFAETDGSSTNSPANGCSRRHGTERNKGTGIVVVRILRRNDHRCRELGEIPRQIPQIRYMDSNCATESIRRLFTDRHIGANPRVENTTYHL